MCSVDNVQCLVWTTCSTCSRGEGGGGHGGGPQPVLDQTEVREVGGAQAEEGGVQAWRGLRLGHTATLEVQC